MFIYESAKTAIAKHYKLGGSNDREAWSCSSEIQNYGVGRIGSAGGYEGRTLSLSLCLGGTFFTFTSLFPCVHIYLQISPFHKDTGLIVLGPTLMTSF